LGYVSFLESLPDSSELKKFSAAIGQTLNLFINESKVPGVKQNHDSLIHVRSASIQFACRFLAFSRFHLLAITPVLQAMTGAAIAN
jgi:hypothetical protein